MNQDLLSIATKAEAANQRPGQNLAAPFLQALHTRGRLRVWSIIITIFGDLVQPRSQADAPARLAFSDLARLTDSLGIAPGALRTAMSRLTKEGWLQRHKEGRSAWYQLSDSGATSTQAASARIYSPTGKLSQAHSEPQVWRLSLYPSTDAALLAAKRQAHIPLGDGLVLGPAELSGAGAQDGAQAFALEGRITALPGWLLDNLVDPAVTQDYRELAALLKPLAEQIAALEALPPHEAAVLRCLLLHFWRRLVLKHRALPLSLLPEDWPGLRCSQLMPPLYRALWAASEAWVDQAGLPARPLGLPRPFAP